MSIDTGADPLELLESGEIIASLLDVMLDKRDAQLRGETKSLRPLKLSPGQKGKLGSIMNAFSNADYSDEQLWKDIQYIGTRYRLFDIKASDQRRWGDPSWLNAKLVFRAEAEESIRTLLGRPFEDPRVVEWHRALNQTSTDFECLPEAALRASALPPGIQDFRELADCWIAVGQTLRTEGAMTWRQLSARCFFGDSKFLDSRIQRTFLRNLYPSLSANLRERPVLLHIVLPKRVEQVLLVENQDSFLGLADSPPANIAIVYSEGYRAGAGRIREPGIAQFSVFNTLACGDLAHFEQWWLGNDGESWPTYFWGDLDFAGMNIAASLRASFRGLQCWSIGYQPMLEYLLQGGGHRPEQAAKEEQRLSQNEDRCCYSSQQLIPALERCSRFVDQEWFPLKEF